MEPLRHEILGILQVQIKRNQDYFGKVYISICFSQVKKHFGHAL